MLSCERLRLTARCLDSLYEHAGMPFDVIVWDNGSRPATVAGLERIAAQRDGIRVVLHDTNVGVAAARNRAFDLVRSDYILSLDNDLVAGEGMVRELVSCALRREAAMVSGLRMGLDGAVLGFADELVIRDTRLDIVPWFHGLAGGDVASLFADSDLEVNYVPGGGSLIERAAFHACGGFSEAYRVGFEDMDFALKAQRLGLRSWATAAARFVHDEGWLPSDQADRDYVLARFDAATLDSAAAAFKAEWGYEVYPEDLRSSVRTRVAAKLKEVGDEPGERT
jgi:GT2 family glycosyltransferase